MGKNQLKCQNGSNLELLKGGGWGGGGGVSGQDCVFGGVFSSCSVHWEGVRDTLQFRPTLQIYLCAPEQRSLPRLHPPPRTNSCKYCNMNQEKP